MKINKLSECLILNEGVMDKITLNGKSLIQYLEQEKFTKSSNGNKSLTYTKSSDDNSITVTFDEMGIKVKLTVPDESDADITKDYPFEHRDAKRAYKFIVKNVKRLDSGKFKTKAKGDNKIPTTPKSADDIRKAPLRHTFKSKAGTFRKINTGTWEFTSNEDGETKNVRTPEVINHFFPKSSEVTKDKDGNEKKDKFGNTEYKKGSGIIGQRFKNSERSLVKLLKKKYGVLTATQRTKDTWLAFTSSGDQIKVGVEPTKENNKGQVTEFQIKSIKESFRRDDMKINKLTESKKIRESNEPEVLWRNRNRSIIKDGYGFGIDNGVTVNRFHINNDGNAVYDYEPSNTMKTTVDRLTRQGKFNNPHHSENPKYVGNTLKYGRGVEEAFEKDGGPFWYFTKHGLGPGMLPKGVNVVDTKEDDNFGTYIALDKVLTTQELKEYELVEKKPEIKEDTHFEFTSGANPYIAKTKDEADRVKRNHKDSAKFIKSVNGIDYYKVDDGEEKDLFSVDESIDDIKKEYLNYCKDLGIDSSKKSSKNRFMNDYAKHINNVDGIKDLEDKLNQVDNELKEAFKPSDSGIQSVKCYNRYNYTIQELRVDNDNKTFERGNFTAGKADKKTQNRQEYEDIVDSLKELGYTEIKSDYRSLRNKTRKGIPTNESFTNKTNLVDKLDNLRYVSMAVDEGEYITIKGGWRTTSRQSHSDYVNINSFLGKELGEGNYTLVYERDDHRDNGSERSCLLRLELKNNFKESWTDEHQDIMTRKTSGYDKCYKIVKKARTSNPVDTNALNDARDHFGYDLYKMCLDDVLKELDESKSININETIEKGTPVTLWWKDDEWSKDAPSYASCEYVGKTKDGKHKFVSTTYGHTFIVDFKTNTITTPQGKTFDLDTSSGWTKKFNESKATHCVYFSMDGGKTQEIEFEGTEDECQDYIEKQEADNEFGDEAPERFVKRIDESKESDESELITQYINNGEYDKLEKVKNGTNVVWKLKEPVNEDTATSSNYEFDDDVDDLTYYYDDETFKDNLENSPYTEIASKQVTDSDGFMTDYTMYMNINTGEYVFVFGDKDVYSPEDGYFDWECETKEEAEEWFNSYTGFDDMEDDEWGGYNFDLDEDVEKSPIVHKKSDGSYLVTAENGDGYVAYNKDDVCMGNISANNENEAKSKFNSNQFDE